MKRNVLLPLLLLILISIVSNVSGIYQATSSEIYLPLVNKGGTQPNEPDISYSAPHVDFDQVEQNQQSDQTITIYNDGLQTLSITSLTTTTSPFIVVSPSSFPVNIVANGSQNVIVRYSPTAIGTNSGALNIVSNDPNEGTVSIPLSGEGITPPADVDLSVSQLDFGQVDVGSSADLTFDIDNDGNQSLSVTSLLSSDSQFSIVTPATPFNVASGGSETVTVRFSPTVVSVTMATLTISSSDPDEPTVSLDLEGEGVPFTSPDPEITVDLASLTFGDLLVNTTDSIDLTISNVGNQQLDVSSIGITNTTYSIISPSVPFSIAAGNNQVVEVQFFPTAIGEQVGDFIINSNDPDEAQVLLPLQGVGVAPEIDSEVTAVDFGNVDTSTSATSSVTISNTGGYTLTLTSFTFDNATFTMQSPSAPVEIAPNGSQELIIEFDPTVIQNESGDLDIANDDSDENPYTISLEGDGVDLSNQMYEEVTDVFNVTPTHTLHATECVAPPLSTGSAWADYDNDGDVDVYMTNAGGSNYLYRNDGDNGDADSLPNFTDVASSLSVQNSALFSLSAVFIDYDNDGDQDLYVTNIDGNTLFKNLLIENGSVSFTDVTATAGVADTGRGITTAWADYDNDGDLDFYIAKHRRCSNNDSQQDNFYENNGDGTFSNANAYLCSGAGSCDQLMGLGFSPGWFDYDNDGDQDLYIVNDNIGGTYEPNIMWRNDGSDGLGGWTFTDVSVVSNLDVSVNGMGLAFGDFDNDSDFDVAFSNQAPAVFMENNGNGAFADRSASSGVQGITSEVTWGTIFLDYDNDRDLDLYFVAGSIQTQAGNVPNYLLQNNDDGTFTDVSAGSGADDPDRGRSASYVDFDGDGWMDILVGNYGTGYVLYRNRSADIGNTNYSLVFTVEGTDSNFDGIGTRISVTAGGETQMREISSGPTHGGGDQRIAQFGLGSSDRGTVRVEWPNGEVQDLGSFDAGEYHLVEPSVAGPDISAPVSLDFGNVETNSERDLQLSISNTGTTTLTISSLTTTDPLFTVQSPTTPVDVAASGSVNVVVRFSPTSDGAVSADLTIVSNDPDESPLTVDLDGTAVTPSSTTFVNVTASANIVESHTLSGTCSPPVGTGSAWADYDNDGDIDAYVTNHGAANRLYRNDGDIDSDGVPEFTDVAVSMGLDDASGVGHAVNFIDYDNDGDQDLFYSNHGSIYLYQNGLVPNGTVSFTDVTTTAGLSDNGRVITAAWADFDNDGNLDVYLGKHAYCGGSDPRNADKLYHSNGDGTFTDRTDWLCTGCDAIDNALAFAPGWLDYDNDGDLDLYVVNDILQGDGSGGAENFRNVLWRNDGSDGIGGWNFAEVSTAAGVDAAVNGMGLGMGDYDNDGDLDIAFSDVGASTLYSNDGDGTFTDVSGPSGAGTGSLTWGTAFFDYNNDGWLDLYFVSGLIGPGGVTPNIFLENNQNGTFTDISVNAGLNDDGRGRHAAVVDFDLDGLVDVFVANYGDAPVLYQNRADAQGNSNHWLAITVEGTDSNRDGIGTRLTFTAGGVTQIREINSGATHGGGDYRAAYFGLGSNTSGTLTIDWPNGEQEIINITSGDIDQYLHRVEPAS